MERFYKVRTPEMVDFTFPVAGLASRFLAWFVDVLVIVAIGAGVMTVLWIVLALLVAANPAVGIGVFGLIIIVFFVLNWGYFAFYDAFRDGRTPGKRLLGLRTIGASGVRLTLAQAGVRNLFRALDCQPGVTYVLGALSHAFSPAGQRIGDRVAGTVVVREESRSVPRRIGFPEAKYNSFLEDPAVATRIARALRADEREVLLELLLRRDELELATRTELFAKLARHLEARLELPKERFLSDEKLVMNVAQAVVETERRRTLLVAS